MGFLDEKLWEVFEEKVEEEDANIRKERQIGDSYKSAIKQICRYGIDRAKTIRDTFPMFTLHDETHICNVMRLMADLLGDHLKDLTRDEAAMLILSACCHDIGMSYSEEEKEELFTDNDRLNQYLENNPHEYVRAFSSGNINPVMTDDMIQNYLRNIHHERIAELLYSSKCEWPNILNGKVDRENLIRVCQSHGKDITELNYLDATSTIDLRFCAILLRLADILDFDTSRAPEAVYEYSGFKKVNDTNKIKSKEEWDKHLASQGFDFSHIRERTYMYLLDYSATCKAMQVEQTVNCYLDWVDQELDYCSKQLKRFTGKWQDFILPGKIKRNIKSEGYVSGQYRLSLDQDKILELLIGKDLYSDPSIFVRELIQNAIDAVRTREQLDRNLPPNWKGQINIRCWMDQEGYHWFRIEDNGIGMTEEIIMNYLLKIGSSYYSSDIFTKSKLQCKADSDYMPISRFGIGILSCFMGDKRTNQVEISTKHFKEGVTDYPALRLNMHGINGYYYLSNKKKNHIPEPMKGVTPKEKAKYLTEAGTAIAVRTSLYQSGKYRGFKEIVDQYVIYPPVAIHYDGEEGSYDYLTEEDFLNAIDSICSSDNLGENGLKEFVIPDEKLKELYNEMPGISFKNPPKLLLKCISLGDYTSTSLLKGALLVVKVEGGYEQIKLKLGDKYVEINFCPWLEINNKDNLRIHISLNFTSDFQRQMDLSYKKCQDILFNFGKAPFYEEFNRDILRNLMDPNSFYRKEDIIKKCEASKKELNKTINEMIEFINSDGNLNIKVNDIEILEKLKTLQSGYSFEICSLSEFEWYYKYFKNLVNMTGTYGIVAHNGIFCGDASFFCDNKGGENLAAIILLKDKYRPYLDIARNGIHGLTLETASEMEIIKNNIINQGFDIGGCLSDLREENYSYIVMADYCKLLNERDDLVKKLIFKTEEGLLSNEGLTNKLLKKKKIRCLSFPTIFDKKNSDRNKYLYEYLCTAFLRENYSLQIDFTGGYSEVFISKKKKVLSDDYKKVFPSCFFLPDLNKNSIILTTKSVNHRYACNEYHRLSQFIIKNGVKLNEYAPGILRELLRTLAEDEYGILINNINSLLEYLKKLPEGLFEIPEKLLLSEKDFV